MGKETVALASLGLHSAGCSLQWEYIYIKKKWGKKLLLFTRWETHFLQSSFLHQHLSTLFWKRDLWSANYIFIRRTVGVTITFWTPRFEKPALPTPHCLVIQSLCALEDLHDDIFLRVIVCRRALLRSSHLCVFLCRIHSSAQCVYLSVFEWGCNSAFIYNL